MRNPKMQTSHNPDRFMADLRQILSQGRKRLGLLVGAGAPMAVRVDSAGRLSDTGVSLIPGVDTLTGEVLDGLDPVYATAIAGIQQSLGAAANIEMVLSKVRLLHQAIGSEKVHGLDSSGFKSLGEAICKAIGERVGAKLPSVRCAFEDMVSWISGTQRLHPIEIFTTNYDLLFESAFERAKAPYFDGFSGGAINFFDPVSVASDDLPPRWSRLWKLHGSLGWDLVNGSVVRTQSSEATALIYPDHLKYDLTQKQPYAALFERLKRFLTTPDSLLLVTGFSFRDAHICAVLEEALAANSNSALFAFQYQTLTNEQAAVRLASSRPNMSVYAADGAIISGVQGGWSPGEAAKNWQEIRSTFWGSRNGHQGSCFLLGDFQYFAQFCALAQAKDLKGVAEEVAPAPVTPSSEATR